jgi:hypothetical protein
VAQSEKAVSALLDYLCPSPTLGDMLDGLVRHLMSAEYPEYPVMRAERREFARANLRSFTVWRYRFRDGAIGASLMTSAGSRSFREPVGGLLPLMEEGLEDRGIPAAAAMDIVVIPSAIFEILADLALDTERAHGHKPSSDATGGPVVEDTETATPATGGTGPASVEEKAGQPRANAVSRGVSSDHQDSGRKKRGQSSPPQMRCGSSPPDTSNQLKDEPPWQKSNLRMRSAG